MMRRLAWWVAILLALLAIAPLAMGFGSGASRETSDYDRGVALTQSASLLPPGERERKLNDAHRCFQNFLGANPEHPQAISAKRHLAALSIERGEIRLAQSQRMDALPAEKQRLQEDARELFLTAQKSLETIDAQLAARGRAEAGADKSDPAGAAARQQTQGDIISTRMALARAIYDIALTYELGSAENRKFLAQAAAESRKYRRLHQNLPNGSMFFVQEARCLKELGDHARAAEILQELTTTLPSDDAEMRGVRTLATELALEIALSPQVKRYREAWALYENWKQNIRHEGDLNDAATSAVQYLGGEAAMSLARGLGESDPEEAHLRNFYRNRARALFSVVAQLPGPHQSEARRKLSDLQPADAGSPVELPKTYEEACDRAKLAWSRLQEANLKSEEIGRLRGEATQCLRFALTNAPRIANADELDVLRSCLAYLDWIAGEYYDAAVLGESLARGRPDRPEAQDGAKIALAAYIGMLFDDATSKGRRFAVGRIADLAQWTTKQWPNTPTADEAWFKSVRAELLCGDCTKAAERLEHISPNSPRRADAELAVGQLLWRDYCDAMRLPEANRPSKARLTETISSAKNMLETGIARLRKSGDEKAFYPLALGALSLSQIYLERSEAEKAVPLLTDPKIGVYAVAPTDDKTDNRDAFRTAAFKTLLRAYAALQQPEKIEETIQIWEKLSAGENLARAYIGLGRQLDASLRQLRSEGKSDAAAQMAGGLELLLARVADRPDDDVSFDALYWVAETLVRLGDGRAAENGLNSEAEKDYRKAIQIYRRILKICQGDPTFATQPDAATAVQIRLARCFSRLEEFDRAIDAIIEILKVRNNRIDAQREAAAAYQAWGRQRPAAYLLAIRGSRRIERADGGQTRLVWGWSGIARRLQNSAAYEDAFHEACYNVARCRMDYALSRSGKEREEWLRQAERDILAVLRIRPKMGGEKWFSQNDALLRSIQARLGVDEDQRGLKAAERNWTTAGEKSEQK